MAYTVPYYFEHGSVPNTTRMQIYSDDITFLYDRLGGIAINVPAQRISGSRTYTMIHRYRWLFYRGTGYLELFSGSDLHRTSLTTPDGAWYAALDLNSLSSWLFAGDLYVIAGVTWALEDSNP